MNSDSSIVESGSNLIICNNNRCVTIEIRALSTCDPNLQKLLRGDSICMGQGDSQITIAYFNNRITATILRRGALDQSLTRITYTVSLSINNICSIRGILYKYLSTSSDATIIGDSTTTVIMLNGVVISIPKIDVCGARLVGFFNGSATYVQASESIFISGNDLVEVQSIGSKSIVLSTLSVEYLAFIVKLHGASSKLPADPAADTFSAPVSGAAVASVPPGPFSFSRAAPTIPIKPLTRERALANNAPVRNGFSSGEQVTPRTHDAIHPRPAPYATVEVRAQPNECNQS